MVSAIVPQKSFRNIDKTGGVWYHIPGTSVIPTESRVPRLKYARCVPHMHISERDTIPDTSVIPTESRVPRLKYARCVPHMHISESYTLINMNFFERNSPS